MWNWKMVAGVNTQNSNSDFTNIKWQIIIFVISDFYNIKMALDQIQIIQIQNGR